MIKDILDNNRQKLQKWQNYRLDDRNIVSYIRDAYNIENVSSSAARLISNFQPVVKKDSELQMLKDEISSLNELMKLI